MDSNNLKEDGAYIRSLWNQSMGLILKYVRDGPSFTVESGVVNFVQIHRGPVTPTQSGDKMLTSTANADPDAQAKFPNDTDLDVPLEVLKIADNSHSPTSRRNKSTDAMDDILRAMGVRENDDAVSIVSESTSRLDSTLGGNDTVNATVMDPIFFGPSLSADSTLSSTVYRDEDAQNKSSKDPEFEAPSDICNIDTQDPEVCSTGIRSELNALRAVKDNDDESTAIMGQSDDPLQVWKIHNDNDDDSTVSELSDDSYLRHSLLSRDDPEHADARDFSIQSPRDALTVSSTLSDESSTVFDLSSHAYANVSMSDTMVGVNGPTQISGNVDDDSKATERLFRHQSVNTVQKRLSTTSSSIESGNIDVDAAFADPNAVLELAMTMCRLVTFCDPFPASSESGKKLRQRYFLFRNLSDTNPLRRKARNICRNMFTLWLKFSIFRDTRMLVAIMNGVLFRGERVSKLIPYLEQTLSVGSTSHSDPMISTPLCRSNYLGPAIVVDGDTLSDSFSLEALSLRWQEMLGSSHTIEELNNAELYLELLVYRHDMFYSVLRRGDPGTKTRADLLKERSPLIEKRWCNITVTGEANDFLTRVGELKDHYDEMFGHIFPMTKLQDGIFLRDPVFLQHLYSSYLSWRLSTYIATSILTPLRLCKLQTSQDSLEMLQSTTNEAIAWRKCWIPYYQTIQSKFNDIQSSFADQFRSFVVSGVRENLFDHNDDNEYDDLFTNRYITTVLKNAHEIVYQINHLCRVKPIEEANLQPEECTLDGTKKIRITQFGYIIREETTTSGKTRTMMGDELLCLFPKGEDIVTNIAAIERALNNMELSYRLVESAHKSLETVGICKIVFKKLHNSSLLDTMEMIRYALGRDCPNIAVCANVTIPSPNPVQHDSTTRWIPPTYKEDDVSTPTRVRIAVLDSGLDRYFMHLGYNVVNSYNAFHDMTVLRDHFVVNDDTPNQVRDIISTNSVIFDAHGHGTKVASVIAGRGVGVMDPDTVELVICKCGGMMDSDPANCFTTTENIIYCAIFCLTQQVDIVNISYGLLEIEVNEALVRALHLLNMFYATTFAMGNSSDVFDTHPLSDFLRIVTPNIVPVAACSTVYTLSTFSNYVEDFDTVIAPGEGIPTYGLHDSPDRPVIYDWGTSMAAPIVAACLGRYRLRYPTVPLHVLRERFMRETAMVPSFDENDDIIIVEVAQRLQLTHIQL